MNVHVLKVNHLLSSAVFTLSAENMPHKAHPSRCTSMCTVYYRKALVYISEQVNAVAFTSLRQILLYIPLRVGHESGPSMGRVGSGQVGSQNYQN